METRNRLTFTKSLTLRTISAILSSAFFPWDFFLVGTVGAAPVFAVEGPGETLATFLLPRVFFLGSAVGVAGWEVGEAGLAARELEDVVCASLPRLLS